MIDSTSSSRLDAILEQVKIGRDEGLHASWFVVDELLALVTTLHQEIEHMKSAWDADIKALHVTGEHYQSKAEVAEARVTTLHQENERLAIRLLAAENDAIEKTKALVKLPTQEQLAAAEARVTTLLAEQSQSERVFEAVVHTYEGDDQMIPADLIEVSFVKRAKRFRLAAGQDLPRRREGL